MTFLMPFGYGNAVVTEEQLKQKATFNRLHPEVQRRFLALSKHLSAMGVQLGVGTGWRVQPATAPGSGFAKPGNSWHEGVPVESNANALAIDTVPASSWDVMEKVAHLFGFRTFRYVNKEPWHIQPFEIPAGRNYATKLPPLQTFPLPGTPTPPPIPIYPGATDMFKPVQPYRNSDTRVFGVPLVPNRDYEFGLDQSKIPANAVAISMVVTAIGGPSGSYLTVWPSGAAPFTSLLNFSPNTTIVNNAYVGGIKDRKFKLRCTGQMHVLCEVHGYWTP